MVVSKIRFAQFKEDGSYFAVIYAVNEDGDIPSKFHYVPKLDWSNWMERITGNLPRPIIVETTDMDQLEVEMKWICKHTDARTLDEMTY